MGLLGGIVGVLLGWTIGHVINFGTNIYLKRQSLPPESFWSVPWWLVAPRLFLLSLSAWFLALSRRRARLGLILFRRCVTSKLNPMARI